MVSILQRPSRTDNHRGLNASTLPAILLVAVYRRVSSEEQVEGYSLDAQTRAIRAYCESHGWGIVHEYADEGKSARYEDLDRRPDFKAMLADADA